MATDKRINYSMQGHKKPARNYLGKQKTVKNIPIKWKSGPKAPETELAYITKKEKNLLLKKDLHGSLKNGPNTGPDGIMSLDSQGDYTADRSPAGRTSGGGGGDRSRQAQAQHQQHMKDILTGQKNIGQTAAVSDRVRRGAVPEYVYGPDGKPKYVGSAYKDTGRRGFLSRLFGGANRYGYAPVKGLRSIQTRGTPGQRGFEYFSEDEDVGDIKPGWGGRILGGLAGLATGIPFVGSTIGGAIDKGKGIFGKQPRDMSQFNKLSLTPYNEQKISLQNDVPMARTDRWTTPAVTGTDQDYQTALGEGWATDYTGEDTNNDFVPQNLPLYPNVGLGAAEGGRIGYERGRVVNPGGYQGEEEGVDSVKHAIMLEQMDKLEKMIASGLDSDGRLQARLDQLIATPTTGLGTGPDLVLPDEKAQGGRIGYRDGEFVEDVNIEGPGYDENVMMASDPDAMDSLNELSKSLFEGRGVHELTPEEYDILIDVAKSQAAGPEQDQGLASLV